MNALILLSSKLSWKLHIHILPILGIILGSQAFPQQSVRSRCPPKPPTLKEFNATEVIQDIEKKVIISILI